MQTRINQRVDASRVLVVEDDLATMFAVRAMFLAKGWEVECSKTVAAAREMLDPVPDWVILDLGLADGDGEELLSHIREFDIPVRVAVVSGMLDPERLEGLRPLEPDIVLPKPVKFDQLITVCEKSMSLRHEFSNR